MGDSQVKSNQEQNAPSKSWFGVRHYQVLLMSFSILISYGIRASLSVAIISMTDKSSSDPSIPTYPDWDDTDVVLSSFVWGYIVPQIAAGQMSEYFGPKWFLVVTMIIGSLFHIAIPAMAAALGSTGVTICRVMEGLNQGFLFPSISNLISKWTPLFERARISNFVYGASVLGIATSMPLTGVICGSQWGWPVAFYVFGSLGVLWALIFAVFAENSPATHKTISQAEKDYINSSNSITTKKKKIPTPWRSILTSLPVYALIVSGFGQCWGGFTLLTEIPSYMSSMLKFDIKSNSQLSAVPYIVQFVFGFAVSPLFDQLIAKKILTITAARKLAQTAASAVSAIALVVLAFLENFDKDVVLVLLIVPVTATAFQYCGYMVNAIDIAPNHSGTVFGLSNAINNISSILAPLTVGFLGKDKTDPILWRKVFLVAAGIYAGCGLFYVIFGSAELQKWNDENMEDESEQNA